MRSPISRAFRIAAAILFTALSARLDHPLPGSPVPQSLQSLAVVVIGVWLGGTDAAIALLLYLVLGVLGLPLFAGGASGWGVASGPSGGYLVGFIVAAWTAGRLSSGRFARSQRTILHYFGIAILAHLIILACGGLGLVVLRGATVAWTAGVLPFLWGGVAKSIAAALFFGFVAKIPVTER